MEKGNYICELCNKEYEPTKRGVQRFCFSKCRKKYNYYLKKNKSNLLVIPKTTTLVQSEKQKNKIEEMSLQGVGNSFLGGLMANFVTEIGKNLFTPKEFNEQVNATNQRYIPVLNMPKGFRNSTPYFDLEKQHLIYVPDPNYNDSADSII